MTDLEALVALAPQEELLRLIGQLAQAQAAATARLLAPVPAPRKVEITLPHHISVAQAAKDLGVSRQWLYHTEGLPFVRRLGRRVVVDVRLAADWLQRQGGA
jgi:hypothetical protein